MSDFIIKVSTEEMIRQSNEIEKTVGEIKTQFENISRLAEGSARYWEGEAENLHLSSFRRISESHEEIIRRLSEHPRDLMTMAGIYAEGEEKSSEDANSLQNNVFG